VRSGSAAAATKAFKLRERDAAVLPPRRYCSANLEADGAPSASDES